jgi:TonB family protein
MISYRQRRCPLRKPRVWLWALAVILPGHVLAAYALNWHRLGQSLVACPFPTPMRVALVAAPTSLSTQQTVAKSSPQHRPKQPEANPAPRTAASQPQPSMNQANLEPAAGSAKSQSVAPSIIGIQSLGFLMQPSPPAYPARSRARGEEGTAMLLAQLSGQGGIPQLVKLEKSSGFSALDTAALHAAKSWHFNAPQTPIWVRLPVRFALND